MEKSFNVLTYGVDDTVLLDKISCLCNTTLATTKADALRKIKFLKGQEQELDLIILYFSVAENQNKIFEVATDLAIELKEKPDLEGNTKLLIAFNWKFFALNDWEQSKTTPQESWEIIRKKIEKMEITCLEVINKYDADDFIIIGSGVTYGSLQLKINNLCKLSRLEKHIKKLESKLVPVS